jgi:thioredoxin-related protein
MRQIKKIILLLYLFSLCACVNNTEKKVLTGENGFYWDVMQDGNRKFSKPGYCYFFGTDGSCTYYAYMKYPGKPVKRIVFDYGDVVYPATWQVNFDTLVIEGFNNKIVSIKPDEIILIQQNESKDTVVLRKSNFKE